MAVKQILLSDLIPNGTIHKLLPVMDDIRSGRVDISLGKRTISEILAPLAPDLLAKGVLAEYLAWWLVNCAVNGDKQMFASSPEQN